MDITKYTRRTFEVEAVQISFENIEEVAAWCGGRIEKRSTRMMGTTAMLPVISLKGTGVEHGNYYIGYLNCWVVKMGKTSRIYKPEQFEKTFTKVNQKSLDDVLQMIADAGWELYGHILPVGTIPDHESHLNAKVKDAIDQALEIATAEVDAHHSDCVPSDLEDVFDQAEAARSLEPKTHNSECEV